MNLFKLCMEKLPKGVVFTGCSLAFVGFFFAMGGVGSGDVPTENWGWSITILGEIVLLLPLGVMSLMNRIRSRRHRTSF